LASNDLQAGVPIAAIKSNIGSILGALAHEHSRIVLQNVVYTGPTIGAAQ